MKRFFGFLEILRIVLIVLIIATFSGLLDPLFGADIPVCPKCHSRDVTINYPPPEPDKEVPLDEYFGSMKMVYAVYIMTTVTWKCNKCNETGEITY